MGKSFVFLSLDSPTSVCVLLTAVCLFDLVQYVSCVQLGKERRTSQLVEGDGVGAEKQSDHMY